MYKRPSKRALQRRLAITYSIMTISVIAIVAILVLLVLNYRFDSATGTLEQRALLQFSTQPSGAQVLIDGKRIFSRTPAKSSVYPGSHTLTLSREGYRDWQKTVTVDAGTLVWFDYARLVPNELPVEVINTYDKLDASLAAPTNRAILLQPDEATPEFRLVNINDAEPRGETIALPASIYQDATTSGSGARTETITHNYKMMSWDDGGRYVLIKHTYSGDTEWLVLDTRNPERSKNITQVFDINISEAVFSGTSGNVLYVRSDNNLRKLDINGGTISRPLVTGVASFDLYDSNYVTYISTPDEETDERIVGLYREGDEAPVVLRTVTDPDVRVSVAMARYLNDTYIAVAEGTSFEVRRGNYTESSDETTKLVEKRLTSNIDAISFNSAGNYVFVQAGSEYASYSTEHGFYAASELADGHRATGLTWADSMHVWSEFNGALQYRDIDGANRQEINAVAPGQAVTFSRNGTYLYSFGKTDDGIQLQRVRMILR